MYVYLYSFERFFGFDKVCVLDESSSAKKIKPGDLLVFGNQYFLALGKELSFSEQYHHLTPVKAELVYKEFLTESTMNLLHWMVATYYTTYKSVMKLFVSADVQKLLEREMKSVKSVPSKRFEPLKSSSLQPFSLADQGQTLIVFPDLRTMFSMISEEGEKEERSKGAKDEKEERIVRLCSSDTDKQKDIHRWEIKKGMKSVILCTYAELFQDFYDLKKIIFVDPHKRYYASQQDPRYKVEEVLATLAQLHGAKVETMGV